MKKVNKTDAATLLNNFKVDLYITALTAVEVALITHSVMYCEIFSTVMAIMVLSLSALAPDHSLLMLLCCAYCHVFPDNGESHTSLPGRAHPLSWPGTSEGILKFANR